MRVLFLDEVDSTQRIATEWAQRGERMWDAVCAKHQTAGRGRRGTLWHDEPGASLLVSLILWDVPLPHPPSLLGVATALATAEALERRFPSLPIRLKYPNDLMLYGRKLGGVLVELVGETAVAGIGVNLLQREFPEPLREVAISVWQGLCASSQAGCPPPPEGGEGTGEGELLTSRELHTHLIEGIGKRLRELTMQVAQAGTPLLYALWQARDETPGRPYQVLDLPEQPVGIALQVEPDFRLRLRLPDGKEHSTYLVNSMPLS